MWQRARERTPRWLALVAIATVAVGSYAIAPAIGGSPKLTTKRAKSLFYTKTQANSRYFTKSAADARFLPKQSGETVVTLDPWDWEPGAGLLPGNRTEEGGYVAFTASDSGNEIELHDGSLPTQVVSKGLRLEAVEICFELTAATIDRLEVFRSGPIGGDPIPTQITFIDDGTDRIANECVRTDAPPAPVSGAAVLDLRMTVDFAGPGEIDIGRTSAVFVP